MKNAKEIIKISLILFLITAISACLLGYANSITAPIIAENTRAKQAESMKKVLPDAAEFEEITGASLPDDISANITSLYRAVDANGETVGVCAMTAANGYGGELTMAVGVTDGLTVSGIDIVSHSETPGLGSKATGDDFKSQFNGKSGGINVQKSGAAGNDINAISGATITSNAVTLSVNSAVAAAEIVMEEAE